MSYTENTLIRTRDCDMFGRWKPSAMLEAMQEVAIAHCEAEHLGRRVTDGLGVVWVLSRCRVELSRAPRCGDEISIETYAMPMKHLFFPRAHVFRDAGGQVIGGGHGLWLLMDVHTRRVVRTPFVEDQLPFDSREAPVRAPITVKPLADDPETGTLTPRFAEYDLNGHVNNTRYLDWCCDALGFDVLREREIAAFDINYDGEIRPGESIRTELCLDGDAFSFCGFGDDRRRFAISGQLGQS